MTDPALASWALWLMYIVGQGVFEGEQGCGGIFRDMLAVEDAEVLYRYGDAFYTEYAAVTRKKQADGTALTTTSTPSSDSTVLIRLSVIIWSIIRAVIASSKPQPR